MTRQEVSVPSNDSNIILLFSIFLASGHDWFAFLLFQPHHFPLLALTIHNKDQTGGFPIFCSIKNNPSTKSQTSSICMLPHVSTRAEPENLPWRCHYVNDQKKGLRRGKIISKLKSPPTLFF